MQRSFVPEEGKRADEPRADARAVTSPATRCGEAASAASRRARTHRPIVAGLGLGLAVSAWGCGGGGGGGGSAAVAAAISSATTTLPPPQRTAPANLATGPALVLDPGAQPAAFFDLPWPSDARLLPGGGPDTAGLPNPLGKDFIRRIYELGATDAKGFSPSGVVWLRFDAPITAPVDDPLLSVAPDSPVFVVDIDPTSSQRLTRRPVHAQVTTSASSYRPANLLQLLPVPGIALRPKTTYAAIVLRRLGAPGTPFLGQAPALTELLAGRAPAGVRGAALQQAYAPLARALVDLRLHPDDIAAATVFTTGDPAESLLKQVAHVAASPALRPSEPLVTRDVYPTFTALKSAFSAPAYQEGVPPYVWGGRQVVDAQGLPVAQRHERAELQLSVPKGRMPATGFPLYFYCHGTGGLASQAIDRGRVTAPDGTPAPGTGIASIIAPVGWATACMAGHMSPGRIGLLSADGYAAYNVLNAVAMRDNFVQMVLEHVHFRNLLLALRIDPALCPGTDASASPDGKVFFDPRLVVVSGQSLGSYLTGMLAGSVDDAWAGAVLSGAGGSWVEFGFGPKDPFDLQVMLEALTVPRGEKLDRFHPVVMAFDLAVGRADNTHYVRRLHRDAPPGRKPPHILVVEGHADAQVPTNLQRALVLAIKADLAGNEAAPLVQDQVAPVLPWGGQRQLPYPLGGNLTLPTGEARTCVVVRYPEDGIKDGHYVITQRDEPKRQVREFVDAIARGQVPIVR